MVTVYGEFCGISGANVGSEDGVFAGEADVGEDAVEATIATELPAVGLTGASASETREIPGLVSGARVAGGRETIS